MIFLITKIGVISLAAIAVMVIILFAFLYYKRKDDEVVGEYTRLWEDCHRLKSKVELTTFKQRMDRFTNEILTPSEPFHNELKHNLINAYRDQEAAIKQ